MIKGKAQAILGFIFAFIAILGLGIGIVRIWAWFNANYAHRAVPYQQSRLAAASPYQYRDPHDGVSTYIDVSGQDTTTNPDTKYKPLELTEDWVFKGIASGQVASLSGTIISREAIEDICQTTCSKCGDSEDTFDVHCPCYIKCICQAQIQPTIDGMQRQANDLRTQADRLHQSAREMRNAAERCDDPWEVCWYGGFGKTAKELRQGADELDRSANELTVEAADLDTKGGKIQGCCNLNSEDDQDACLEGVQQEACNDTVTQQVSVWSEKLNSLTTEKQSAEDTISRINNDIAGCNASAASTCNDSCSVCSWNGDTGLYGCSYLSSDGEMTRNFSGATAAACSSACYNSCYEEKRNFCCTGSGCRLGGVGARPEVCGRQCDAPSTNCDDGSGVKCGLSLLAARIQAKIDNELAPAINKLQQNIDSIRSCCSRPTINEQGQCISDLIAEEGS